MHQPHPATLEAHLFVPEPGRPETPPFQVGYLASGEEIVVVLSPESADALGRLVIGSPDVQHDWVRAAINLFIAAARATFPAAPGLQLVPKVELPTSAADREPRDPDERRYGTPTVVPGYVDEHGSPATPDSPPETLRPCRTCNNGSTRETVGMVCRTCGTDYSGVAGLL